MQEIEKLAIGLSSKLSKIFNQCVYITEERTVYAPEPRNLRGSGFPQFSLLRVEEGAGFYPWWGQTGLGSAREYTYRPTDDVNRHSLSCPLFSGKFNAMYAK